VHSLFIRSFAIGLLLAPSAAFAQASAPPGPTPPAPSTGAASEDRDEPAPASPAPGSGPAAAAPEEPQFYHPTAQDMAKAPPTPGMPWMLTLLQDTHDFVVSPIRGWGDETRVRFGTDYGVTIGTFQFDTFELGFDAFRYRGIELVKRTPGNGLPFSIYLLIPNLDARAFIGSQRFGVAVGTSATGVRLASCEFTGCIEASLRLPTIDFWEADDHHFSSFAVSVGGGISAGMKL
jgi:hypothetical protein